jgi:hypothetical protein
VYDLRLSFELRPLEDVRPWGTLESGFHLHGFGLTDGWYDVVVGEHRLFSTPDWPIALSALCGTFGRVYTRHCRFTRAGRS